MTDIVIEGRTYVFEDLSADAQQQIVNLRVVDQELARLNAQTAIAQTARLAYSEALQSLLRQHRPGREPSVLERAMAAGETLNLK